MRSKYTPAQYYSACEATIIMKAFILVTLLVVAVSASLLEEHIVKFQTFKLQHGKTYKNHVEESRHFSIFRDNLQSIEAHNALYEQGLATYKQGITPFADMTPEEFRAMLTLHQKPSLNSTIKYVKNGVTVPNEIDWREEGQVTGVKDQGFCGSCWAFSVTGSTEAAYYRKSGKLVSLSEQQLVDCTLDVNEGCSGGYLEQTFPYIEENGLESEENYAYTGFNGLCKYNSSKVVTKVSKYVTISGDEGALLEAVGTVGPVSVAIDATLLQFYFSGIFSNIWCNPWTLNHGVLVVGYGSESGKDYWIVKNSWGPSWGESGFFRIKRGVNACGIANDDVYPLID